MPHVVDISDANLSPGTMLAHYELKGPLGSGAMGTVYEAHDSSLDRPVAIKVLRAEVADNPETVTRFVFEARAAARVNHRNLAHIYFVGEQDGHRFFAMEYVPGRTLEEHIAKKGSLDIEEAVDILVQTATGLSAAHQAGVVHRDVKPQNIKIRPDGGVKLLDFGLSKSFSGDVAVTGAGRIMGTPRYMSPEQCRGEQIDWRTDVYALGLLGFYLLTGRDPYDDDSLGMVLDQQMNKPLPSILTERPDLSSKVQRVLERLCAKRPDQRPRSMEEAVDLLESIRPTDLYLAPIGTRAIALLVDAFPRLHRTRGRSADRGPPS